MAYVPEIWSSTVTALPVAASMGQARTLAWPIYTIPPGLAATMVPSRWPQKGVSAVLDFDLDLTDFLAPDSDTINTAAVAVNVGTLTIGAVSHTTTGVKVFLSAGVALTDYLLTWTIVTTAGRTVTPTVRLLVVADNEADLYLTDGAGNILIGPAGAILGSE